MTDTMTYGQLQSALQAALSAMVADGDDDGDSWVYVNDFSDTWVVYGCGGQTFQIDYSVNEDGNVALTGEPEPVRVIQTYAPVNEAKGAGISVELRGGVVPGQARELLGQRQLDAGHIRITSEPLTYHRHAPHSFYRDMILTDRVRGASERLTRHRQEMEVLTKEREERAWRTLRSGDLEYRVTPNRTQGQGGYFTPPDWLNELFATAKRPGRVLASLIPGRFPLPSGVSSINLPIINAGTTEAAVIDNQVEPDQDITDKAGSSTVATLSGQADIALQLLEQSPVGAHVDWAIFTDLTEAYDYTLEVQLLNGAGSASSQLLGVMKAGGESVAITYTSATPTGSGMWPYFGQAAAQVGDGRLLPPEVFLLRTARWAWLNTQEDTAQRPFALPSPFFMGADDYTPDPVGGLIGWPTFLTDAVPATLGTGGNQDAVINMRPSDLILLESAPQTTVMREPGSANLGVRLQLRGYAASVMRHTAGIAVIGGTGMVVQSGY